MTTPPTGTSICKYEFWRPITLFIIGTARPDSLINMSVAFTIPKQK